MHVYECALQCWAKLIVIFFDHLKLQKVMLVFYFEPPARSTQHGISNILAAIGPLIFRMQDWPNERFYAEVPKQLSLCIWWLKSRSSPYSCSHWNNCQRALIHSCKTAGLLKKKHTLLIFGNVYLLQTKKQYSCLPIILRSEEIYHDHHTQGHFQTAPNKSSRRLSLCSMPCVRK